MKFGFPLSLFNEVVIAVIFHLQTIALVTFINRNHFPGRLRSMLATVLYTWPHLNGQDFKCVNGKFSGHLDRLPSLASTFPV